MRNAADKSCRENQNTNFMFSNFFFENRAVSEIMWENTVEPERQQMTIWRMCISRWVPKATHTLGICNINCFSATTMAARKRLHVMLYVHYLSFYFSIFPPFFVSSLSSVLLRVCQFFPLSQYCVTVLFTLCGTRDLRPISATFSTGMFLLGLQEGHCRRYLCEQMTMGV